MPDIKDGESVEMKGSARKPYILTNTGGVYSCTCPAWQFQGAAIEVRTCKHLRKHRGDAEETARVGRSATATVKKSASAKSKGNAPPLLLAHRFENHDDPTGWWLSEKLDGVRAYWNGKEFVSRLGNIYHAPDWFTKELPTDTPLDGELFAGRGEFQKTVSIVRRQDKNDEWKKILFLVFDAPDIDEPFEKRVEVIKETLADGCTYAKALEHIKCKDQAHLEQELKRIEDDDGEGVMLREPGSKYVAGRSRTLLKVKTFYDAEARVKGHTPGRGKHKGRTGALEVELKDGTLFSVGTGLSDKERDKPPAIGAIITFRYQELTKAGVPRFPSYIGERSDVTWQTMLPLPQRRAQGASAVKATSSAKAKKAKPAKSKPAKAGASTSTSTSIKAGVVQHFARVEFDDSKSQKFWEVATRGCDVLIRFGRIGHEGRAHEKTYASESAALAHLEKEKQKKIAKGYVLVTGAKVPSAFGQAAKKTSMVTQTPKAKGSGVGLRRLEYDDGNTQKFWCIERFDNEAHIRFGKIGSEGQVRVKSFDDDNTCKNEIEKLASKKLAKGYVEV